MNGNTLGNAIHMCKIWHYPLCVRYRLFGLAWIEYAAGFIRSDDRTTTQAFGRVVNLEYRATSLVKSSQELAANVKGACSY